VLAVVRLEVAELGLLELIELLELLEVTRLTVSEDELLELLEAVLMVTDCVLTLLAVLTLRELLELLDAVEAVEAVEAELAVTNELLLSVTSDCEEADWTLTALIAEISDDADDTLENEVLDMVCEPMIVLIAASTSVISVEMFVPYLAMSSAVKVVGYSALTASMSRPRSLKDRA